jgi:hypothetical protein
MMAGRKPVPIFPKREFIKNVTNMILLLMNAGSQILLISVEKLSLKSVFLKKFWREQSTIFRISVLSELMKLAV